EAGAETATSTKAPGAGDGPLLTTTTEWLVEDPRTKVGAPETCTDRSACTSTAIAALSLSLSATGSSVCEVAAAVRTTEVPAVAGVATACTWKLADWSAASVSAVHAADVWPPPTVRGSQVQPVGAVTTRLGSSASTARPRPGNVAASGPA